MTVAAISPDGKLLAVGDSRGAIALADAATLKQFSGGLLSEHRAPVRRIAFSADSRSLVSAAQDGELKWWDLPARLDTAAKAPVSRLTFSYTRAVPEGLVISPDGTRVAVGSAETGIFDASSGKLLFNVPGMKAAFSPDGSRLCTGGVKPDFKTAKIWDAQTGKELASLEGGHRFNLSAIAFTPDGKIVLTGDYAGLVRAWDAASGAELLELPGAKDGD